MKYKTFSCFHCVVFVEYILILILQFSSRCNSLCECVLSGQNWFPVPPIQINQNNKESFPSSLRPPILQNSTMLFRKINELDESHTVHRTPIISCCVIMAQSSGHSNEKYDGTGDKRRGRRSSCIAIHLSFVWIENWQFFFWCVHKRTIAVLCQYLDYQFGKHIVSLCGLGAELGE